MSSYSDSDDDKPLAVAAGASTSKANGKRPLPTSGETSQSDADDKPLAKRAKANGTANGRNGGNARKRKKAAIESSDSSDADVPLAVSKASVAIPMPGAIVKAPTSSDGKAKNGRAAKGRVSMKEESDSDVPLGKTTSPEAKKPARKRVKKEVSDDEDDDDKPLAKKPKAAPKKKVKKEESDDEADEDEKPKKKKAAPKKQVQKETDEDDEKEKKPKAKKEPKSPKKKKEKTPEPVHRWWEDEAGEDGVKWTTLSHNGPIFPPPYEPLPPNVKMKYDGKEVSLPPESEEIAGFFGALLESDHAQDKVFCENFFRDWQAVLKDYPPRDGTKIEHFSKCDFRPMYEHFQALREAQKAMSAAEKKAKKEEKDKEELPYLYCMWDGRKEKIGNIRIEPPGLFRGRGAHPKKGSLKHRLRPEDIIINIGKEAPIPKPGMPGQWGKVVHDQSVTWLCNWKENINGTFKYVFLAPGSTVKGMSDMNKFEKARELKKHVDRIRKDYMEDLKSKVTADRQRATAMYFIDRLALRAGNEKGEDEADTVGCCSLRYEHVMLEEPDTVIFDFLGKDSIRYYNRVQVIPQVFKNIRIFKGDGKTDGDALFDRVQTTTLNKHLQSYMKGLTAKVFRTYNASITFQEQLQNTPEDGSQLAKLDAYQKANREVARLCNHQRAIPKTHAATMGKMGDKLRGLKYDRMKLRHALFTIDPKNKKKYPELVEDESDIDEEAVTAHEELWKKQRLEAAKKKVEKREEKKEEGKEEKEGKTYEELAAEIEEEFERLEAERGTGKALVKKAWTTEKVVDMIEKAKAKIDQHKFLMRDRDEGKEVSLGTSKINYLDPRITAAWCKKHDIPITKLFAKTLMTKFPWAMEVEEDWEF